MKHLHLLAFLLPFVLFLSSCGSDDEGNPEPPRGENSVVQIVASDSSLMAINAILSDSNFLSLRRQLESGEYTLLAPNDQAFTNFLVSLRPPNGLPLNLIDTDVLRSIISYHIIPNQTLQANELEGDITTIPGTTINFLRGDSTRLNSEVSAQATTTIVSEPEYGSNGAVYIINEVLLPPNLQPAKSSFGTVAGLLNVLGDVQFMNNIFDAANLTNALSASVRTYTVIAPLDGFAFAENIFAPSLTNFAERHIVNEDFLAGEVPRKVNTQADVPIYITPAGNGVVFLNGIPAQDINLLGSNGRILYLLGDNRGRIVLPPVQSLTSALGEAQELAGVSFSIFQAALAQTGLTLGEEQTILVPTDSAFIKAGLVASVDSAARIDLSVLSGILQAHILDRVVFTSDIIVSESIEATALSGATLTLAIIEEEGSQFLRVVDGNEESEDATILYGISDKLTNSGSVHIIDRLLLP